MKEDWISSNSNFVAMQSLTPESLKAAIDDIVAKYCDGKMVVQLDLYEHVTPCCYLVYSTYGPCGEGECPYCGAILPPGYCPPCQAFVDSCDRSRP